MSFKRISRQLIDAIMAKTPIICLITEEERRCERFLQELSQKAFAKPVPFYVWTCIDGVMGDTGQVPNTIILKDALIWALKQNDTVFVLFKDFKYYLTPQPEMVRLLKDLYHKYSQSFSTIFFSMSSPMLPPDLQREIYVIDIDLPDVNEVEELLERIINSRKNAPGLKDSLTPELKEKLVKASLGLGLDDIERALLKVSRDKNSFTDEEVQAVLEEKHQIISKSGIMEFVPLEFGIADLGGMENLKAWLERRRYIFTEEARDFGLSFPKGILVMGVSGCGKSLLVKACASFWNVPLLRLDMGRIYDETIAAPEASLRYAIKIAEVCAPCVMWIDEIEAGIANAGAKTRGGPGSRVIAHFLTWMQEKKTSVFVGATANEIELVPPEFIRKGRFDEIFYVTLPSIAERAEIFKIHLRARGIDSIKFNLDNLAKGSEGFNGAEVEQVVVSAQFEAFSRKRPITEDDLFISLGRIVPLSTTMKEEIKKLERWAFNRTVKASRNR